MKALIVYHSRTGHTAQAAGDIARGLQSGGAEVSVLETGELDERAARPADFDVVVLGTPVYGYRLYRLPARSVADWLASVGPAGLEGRTCGAFAVNAAWGGGLLVAAMERSLARKGGIVLAGGPVVRAGAPFSLWKGPDASAEDVRKCEDFGRRLAASRPGA